MLRGGVTNGRAAGSECSGGGTAVYDRIVALGAAVCPGRPVVVVDGPDLEAAPRRPVQQPVVAEELRAGRRRRAGAAGGNAPGLQSEVATRLRRFCRYLPPTPYLARARSAAAATVGARAPSPRPLRIRVRNRVVGARGRGQQLPRVAQALRNACKASAPPAAACEWVWISMAARAREGAAAVRARRLLPAAAGRHCRGLGSSTPSRRAVPVIFHPEQATLWPSHWRPLDETSPSGVLFDFTKGVPRPRLRDRDHAQYAAAAEGTSRSSRCRWLGSRSCAAASRPPRAPSSMRARRGRGRGRGRRRGRVCRVVDAARRVPDAARRAPTRSSSRGRRSSMRRYMRRAAAARRRWRSWRWGRWRRRRRAARPAASRGGAGAAAARGRGS